METNLTKTTAQEEKRKFLWDNLIIDFDDAHNPNLNKAFDRIFQEYRSDAIEWLQNNLDEIQNEFSNKLQGLNAPVQSFYDGLINVSDVVDVFGLTDKDNTVYDEVEKILDKHSWKYNDVPGNEKHKEQRDIIVEACEVEIKEYAENIMGTNLQNTTSVVLDYLNYEQASVGDVLDVLGLTGKDDKVYDAVQEIMDRHGVEFSPIEKMIELGFQERDDMRWKIAEECANELLEYKQSVEQKHQQNWEILSNRLADDEMIDASPDYVKKMYRYHLTGLGDKAEFDGGLDDEILCRYMTENDELFAKAFPEVKAEALQIELDTSDCNIKALDAWTEVYLEEKNPTMGDFWKVREAWAELYGVSIEVANIQAREHLDRLKAQQQQKKRDEVIVGNKKLDASQLLELLQERTLTIQDVVIDGRACTATLRLDENNKIHLKKRKPLEDDSPIVKKIEKPTPKQTVIPSKPKPKQIKKSNHS
jgi:hypothetical protein